MAIRNSTMAGNGGVDLDCGVNGLRGSVGSIDVVNEQSR